MSSSAMPRVRGPKMPIDNITINIEAAMNVKTPATPKSRRNKPIKKLVKIALNRFFQRTAPDTIEVAQETTLRLDKDSFV